MWRQIFGNSNSVSFDQSKAVITVACVVQLDTKKTRAKDNLKHCHESVVKHPVSFCFILDFVDDSFCLGL